MRQAGPYRSEWLALLLDAIELAGPELQQRAISRYMVLLQRGSGLMYKIPATIESRAGAILHLRLF